MSESVSFREMQSVRTIHRLPSTNIVIDHWKPVQGSQVIRFMTVFRLTDNQLQLIKTNDYKIYTSPLNKKLLECREVSADRIVAIEPQSSIIITDEVAGYSFEVSIIDSNHCIGSCMFLFQGPFGKVLYTGFFRPAMSCNPLQDPILQPLVENQLINVVYIDNTYAAEHCQFPSRADIVERAIYLIKEHSDHKIIISGSKFGKEEILRDIAMSIKENIGISKSKYADLLPVMMLPQNFCVDRERCRIIVEDELFSFGQCKKKQVEEGLCMILLLTAQYICAERLTGTPAPRIKNMYILPYSSHASHSELMDFLCNLKARCIEPIILTETDNTAIPQKMLDLCYTDEDSSPLRNSDFFFDTCTNEPETRLETIPEISRTSSDDHIIPEENISIDARNMSNINDGIDAPSDSGETNSSNSDVYHESETSAFQIFLEVQDENVLVEGSNDSVYVKDPLSMDDSVDVNIVNDSQHIDSDVFYAASSAENAAMISQDGNVSSSTHGSTIQSSESPQSRASRHNGKWHSNKKRTDDSSNSGSKDELENQPSPNTLNSQPQASSSDEISRGEISSSDIIGSDGLVDKHSQSPSSNENQNQSDGSDINLTIVSRRGQDEFTSQNDAESEKENERQLNTLLYHHWLTTTPEDWRRTGLTIDSWKDLPKNLPFL